MSIPPPDLMNIPADCNPLTRAAPFPTETRAQQHEACQSCQAGCRGNRRPADVRRNVPQKMSLRESACCWGNRTHVCVIRSISWEGFFCLFVFFLDPPGRRMVSNVEQRKERAANAGTCLLLSSTRSRPASPSWVWSCGCCPLTWTRRWRSGRSRSTSWSGRARAWPAWPTTCTCSPGEEPAQRSFIFPGALA